MSPSFLPRASRRLRGLALLCGVLAGCGGQDQPGAKDVAQGDAVKTDAQSAASKTKTPVIEGDRLTNFGPIVLSKQTETSPFRFREITSGSGVDFVHFSGMTEARHFPTANGSGVAVFDYDNDGKLDLYFATCTLIPLGTATKGPNKLYRNLGGGKFEDVTARSGLGFEGFCHGIVVGDIDNDGDQDVFLCNYGTNRLYLNDGKGAFKDISKSAGIDRPMWSSGGVFFDADKDGDLDLYVANYGDWLFPRDDKYCGDPVRKVRLYCSPREVRTVKHAFYRNNGNLTFTDVTDEAGMGRSDGHGFGAVAADLDDDGDVDLYVPNDMNPNFLFLNKGDGTFEDATEANGAAYDEKGAAQSSMGVDAEDVDGDGKSDLYVTNFMNEYNTLYQNIGQGGFMDVTPYFGLASDTMPFVGWGTALADFDNDGWPDNFVANGHVDNNRKLIDQPVEYEEPPLLFANIGVKGKQRRFRLATRDAGTYFASNHVGRGASFGDLDDDGRLDIVVNHKDGAPAILINESKNDNSWIRLKLQGTVSNRDAVGARVELNVGDRTIVRQRKAGYGLMGSNDPRLLIGVGKVSKIAKITVKWPSGAVTTLENVDVNTTHALVEPREVKTAASLKSK